MADGDRLTFNLSTGGDVVIKLRPDLAPGHVAAHHRARQQRLLRRRGVPPRDPRLHGPGRRPDAAPAPAARDLPNLKAEFSSEPHVRGSRLDGAHVRPGQRQQPVLHRASTTPASSTASTPSGARSRAAWNMSTRSPSASRRASPARSSRRRCPELEESRARHRRVGRARRRVRAPAGDARPPAGAGGAAQGPARRAGQGARQCPRGRDRPVEGQRRRQADGRHRSQWRNRRPAGQQCGLRPDRPIRRARRQARAADDRPQRRHLDRPLPRRRAGA